MTEPKTVTRDKVVLTLTVHEQSDGKITVTGGFNPNNEDLQPVSYDMAIFSVIRELSNKAIEVRQR